MDGWVWVGWMDGWVLGAGLPALPPALHPSIRGRSLHITTTTTTSPTTTLCRSSRPSTPSTLIGVWEGRLGEARIQDGNECVLAG